MLEVYDPSTDSWTTATSMPTARTGTAAAAIGGKLHIAGGKGTAGYLSTLEAYNPSTDSWTTATSMPTARGYAATSAISGKLYVAGGWDNNDHSTLEVYDPQVNFGAFLTTGQTLPYTPITLTASTSITDYAGNSPAAVLETTFTPADTTRPSIAIYQPTGVQSDNITVSYVISDPEDSSVGVKAEYSTDTGGNWQAASVTGDTSDIAQADFDSSLVWQSGTDLADQELEGVWFRISPHDAGGWGTPDTTYIDIDNLAPQWVAAEGVVGDTSLVIHFNDSDISTASFESSHYSLSGGLTLASMERIDGWQTRQPMPVATSTTVS